MWGQRLVGAVLSDYRRRQLDENPAGVTSLGIINFTAQTLLWSVVVLLILMVVTMTLSDVLNNVATALVAAPVLKSVQPQPFTWTTVAIFVRFQTGAPS